MSLDASNVRAIFKTALDDSDVTVFLTTAALIVSEDLADSDLTAARKEEITVYLAAHLCTLADGSGRLTSLDASDTAQRFAGKFGEGLMSSPYGQAAVMLDTSGTLAGIVELRPIADVKVHYIDYDTDEMQ